MAEKYEIEVFINEDGELKVHIKGLKGPNCLKALQDLNSRIGGQIKDKQFTSEYYENLKSGTTANNEAHLD